MPVFWSDFDELITGDTMNIDAVPWSGDRLRARFRGGFGASSSVGPASGLYRWMLSSTLLADSATYNDPVAGVPSFQYYEDFIKEHITGSTDIFWIEYRGKKYHASFVENGWSPERLTNDLFAVDGIEIEQRRVEGVIYNDDGSIWEPWSWLAASRVTGVADGAAFSPWTDVSGNRDFSLASASGGTGPLLQTNEVNSLATVEFTTDAASYSVTSVGFTNIWMVVKVREATFGSNRVLLADDATTNVWEGDAGTTKFADGGYGGVFTYKKNGVSYASGNQQAPMNAYGLVHLNWSTAFNFLQEVNIGAGTGGGAEASPIDLAEIIFDTEDLSAAHLSRVETMLMAKYALT